MPMNQNEAKKRRRGWPKGKRQNDYYYYYNENGMALPIVYFLLSM